MTFLSRKPPASRPRRPAWRPGLEALEDRALPSFVGPASPLADPGPAGYTPAQIRQVYGFDRITFQSGTVAGDGGGQTIAIVVAGHDPTLAADLRAFDQQFGLTDPALNVVAQDGSQHFPPADAAWAAETALDVEWAHAMAPGASLVVVEANSTGQADLFAAADWAARQPGVSVVSMSFGSAEDPGETQLAGHFTTPAGHAGVTYVAAAGDTGAVSYPAASSNVVAVGGTTLVLDASNNRVSETAWANGGGGLSEYEPLPDYQADVLPATIGSRGTPDVAYAADPAAGFAVYVSSDGGDPWAVMGGTSAGAPQWAALIAIADQGRVLASAGPLDSRQALTLLYGLPDSAFYDVTAGRAGGSPAGPGYDLATGRGSPVADQVVAGLVSPAAGLPPTITPPAPTSSPPISPLPTTPPPTTQPPTTSAPPPALPPPPAPLPPPSLTTPHGSMALLPVLVAPPGGSTFDGIVAMLTDTFPGTSPGALAAVINWGDGQTSAGTLTPDGDGSYDVGGDHTYDQPGDYPISVTVTDASSHLTEVAQGTADVQPPAPRPAPAPAEPVADPVVMPPPSLFVVMPASRHGRAVHHATHRVVVHHAAHRPARAHARRHVVHVTVPPVV